MKGTPEILPTDLTPCTGGSCRFVYVEWTDLLDGYSAPRSGKFRVFKLETIQDGLTKYLWLKAPMEGIAFSIFSEELSQGRGLYVAECAGCRLIPCKIVSGLVKGNRIPRENMSAPERWVLEISLNLTDDSGKLKRNVYVKQIFNPDFIRPEMND